MAEHAPHPYSVLSDASRDRFQMLVAKRMEIALGVSDETLLELIFEMLENERGPDELMTALTDVVGGPTAAGFSSWIFTTLAQLVQREPADPEMEKKEPHELLKFVLNAPLQALKDGKADQIDWALEKGKVRQAVMKLLAVNAPQPPLPPTSKDYAPLLILQAVLGWLEAQPLAQTQAGLIETTPEIRDYLLSILHVMGFALSSLVERAQEDSSPAWTDPFAPLAVPAAEIFVRLCAGTSKRLSMEQAKENSVSGAALYDKYKRMALPTVKGGETAAAPAAAAPQEEEEEEPRWSIALLDALGNLAPPMSEIFGCSPSCRSVIRTRNPLEATVALRKQPPQVRMLYDLANVLDEEFIILHPAENKAFRVIVSGCSDNKLLGIALAAALIPEHLPGTPVPADLKEMLSSSSPQESAVESWAHPWSFAIWTAVRPDKTVPQGMAGASNWIWPEGIPVEIPLWRGKRVLLLSKAPFPRKFEPVRMFAGLDASVTVKETLDAAALLQEIASTPEAERNEAIAYHKRFSA